MGLVIGIGLVGRWPISLELILIARLVLQFGNGVVIDDPYQVRLSHLLSDSGDRGQGGESSSSALWLGSPVKFRRVGRARGGGGRPGLICDAGDTSGGGGVHSVADPGTYTVS